MKIKEKYLYKNFKEINSLSLKATNFSYRNKKHLNEIKRLKASGDESDANFAKELEKHDTREGVSFKRVFMPSFNYELIASISFFDFYDADYRSVQFITFNQWFNKKLLIEPSLENLIFPSINLESFKNLNTKDSILINIKEKIVFIIMIIKLYSYSFPKSFFVNFVERLGIYNSHT